MKNIKNILYYAVLSGVFLVPFIAFLVPQTMFFPFITGKGFTFRIITEIVFGLYVLLAFYDPAYRPKDSWVTRAVLAFLAIIFVADIFSQNPYKSFWSNFERMEGFVTIVHLVAYYLVASSTFSVSVWKRYININIFASSLMSVYGLFQVFGAITINQGGVRVDATFGNATYLAIYLVFNIFLAFYLLFSSNTKWKKYLYGGVILLQTVVLYYTATRGAILGLLGGLFLAGLFLLWKERENKVYRKISYGLLVSVVVFVGLFISIRNAEFVKNSPVLSRFSTLSFSEIKTQGRYFVWPMAVQGFKERPILGWGQESFNYVFNKNYNPKMFGQEEWFDRTHNIFLDWLIAGGLLGLLAYLSMYFALLYYVLRKDSSFSNLDKSIFVGLISAYLFHNIFVFDNLISYIMFFTVLAFVHSFALENKSKDPVFNKLNFSPTTLNYMVFPVVVIATIFLVYTVNIKAIQANKTLIKSITPHGDPAKNLAYFKEVYGYNSFAFDEATEQLVQAASSIYSSTVPDSIKKEFVDYALQKIKEKIEKTPDDVRYLVFAGSFLNRLGRYDEALVYLERAMAISPNKQSLLFEVGSSYIGKGNLQKMFEIFKKAYELQPTAPESINIYALGAIYTKNVAVQNELSKVINPNIIYDDNRFLKAYSDIGDYNMVMKILNERLKKDPKNPQYKLSLASVYATIGQTQKAVDTLREIAVDHPEYKDEVENYIKQLLGQ